MKRLVSWIYAPAFLLGFLGYGLWQPDSLILLFVIAVVVSFLAEQWLPYEPQWNRSLGDRRRDTLHALVNESLNAVGLLILPGLTALLAFEGIWPRGWPLWEQLLMAIVLADAGITLMHYASHRVRPLWRLHAVHHSVQRLYGFNGLMKHPLHQVLEATYGFGLGRVGRDACRVERGRGLVVVAQPHREYRLVAVMARAQAECAGERLRRVRR